MRTSKTVLTGGMILLSACSMEEVPVMENDGQSAYVLTEAELSINEVLFDPLGEGVDFVEIVNVSPRDLELSDYYIRNRNGSGALGTARQLSKTPCTLPSGEYCLLTSDFNRLWVDYPHGIDCIHLEISSFPSLPNDAGEVVLTTYDDRIVDEFNYSRNMHYPLISNREGISLEKIHPRLASSERRYWCSASTDAGYATPGRINSQYRDIEYSGEENRSFSVQFDLERKWVAPGRLDSCSYLYINYLCDESWGTGPYVANVTLYSWDGAPVLDFARNALLGAAGCYVWNGLDAAGKALPDGCYFIKVECFSQNGKVFRECLPCSVVP